MNSTHHFFVRNHFGFSSRRFAAITAAVATCAIGSVRAQQYVNVGTQDDSFDVQTPPVDELIAVGGFQLRVDRTKWDIALSPGNHRLLGRLQGNDVDITIRVIAGASSTTSAEKTILAMAPLRMERVFTSHAISGLKVFYGDRSSSIRQRITAIRYIFVNPAGETICFEVRAKTTYSDWSDANDLVLNTLSLAHRRRAAPAAPLFREG